MTTFRQPYFWSQTRDGARERWSPVPVTPAITIVSSSVAAASVVTTSTPHGLATGDTVTIAGHITADPTINGARVVTVLTPTTFTVPVTVTTGGTGGTVTRTTAAPVLALADAKLHARMSVDDTTEDVPVANWVRAATQQVERDTGIKLLPQTWDLAGDAFPAGTKDITLPFGPLLSVASITYYDGASPSVLQTMTSTDYLADTSSIPGRIGLADAATWPTDLRWFQPITIRVIVGYASIGLVPEPLLQAVRLAMGWHAMNREPTQMERDSYEWLLDTFRSVAVA